MGRYISWTEENIFSTPPKALQTGGYTGTTVNAISVVADHGALQVACGALTADTYPGTPQISVTGKGVFGFLNAQSVDATTRTVTVKVVIDDVQVAEISNVSDGVNRGVAVIGNDNTSTDFLYLEHISFKKSFKVYVKSSLTETDLITIGYNYRTI